MVQPHVPNQNAFKEGIRRNLLSVTSDTLIVEVIHLMSQTQSSCVLVVDQQRLVGILTERDVVRAIASGTVLEEIETGTLMTRQVITLNEAEANDIFTVLAKFRQHQICHLPVLDSQGQLVGIVTQTSLLQALDPVEMYGVIATLQQSVDERTAELQQELIQSQQLARSLQESQHFAQRIVDATPQILYLFDLSQGSTIYLNRQITEILGYSPEEIYTSGVQWFLDNLHPEDHYLLHNIQERFVNLPDNEVVLSEYQLKHKNGEWRWLHNREVVFTRDANGAPRQILGSVKDISDRKREEAERKQTEELLRSQSIHTAQLGTLLSFEALLKRITEKVRESLDETQILQAAVQELSTKLDVQFCNAIFYALDEMDQEICTVIGEYTELAPELTGLVLPESEFPEMQRQILQGQSCQFCTPVEGWKSSWANVLICPVIDDSALMLGDLLLLRNSDAVFSELETRLVQQVANQCAIAIRQARLHQSVQAQVEALEHLNHLKDDFLSTVSHELRTPMSNIKMAAEMLEITLSGGERTRDISDASSLPLSSAREEVASPLSLQKVTRYLQILKSECQREINLINDLLDLSRLDARTEPLLLTTLNLRAWILHVAEPFIERTQSQGQSLQFNLPLDLPTLTTNFSNLERILTELLTNACKYTPAGETIEVSAQILSAESERQRVEASQDSEKTSSIPNSTAAQRQTASLQISIANSGVEIAESEWSRVFDKFYRISNNDPWKHGGTGLGLALVKKRVEQIQGTVEVSSEPGWTIFTIKLSVP